MYCFADFGDIEIQCLVDHWQPVLIDAGIDIAQVEMEWTLLKDKIYTR